MRDCREPEVLRDTNGRLVLIDQAVLDLIRGRVPPNEPSAPGLTIHSVRPMRLSFMGRPEGR